MQVHKRTAPASLIREAMDWFPYIARIKGIIAGEFIRAHYAREECAMLDIFFGSEQDLKDAEKILTEKKWEKISTRYSDPECESAFTSDTGRIIRLIGFSYKSAFHVLQAFDFTIHVAALELFIEERSVDGQVWLHNDFLEHLAGRTLVYLGSSDPLFSLGKAIAFGTKGYHMSEKTSKKITEDIAASPEEVLEKIYKRERNA